MFSGRLLSTLKPLLCRGSYFTSQTNKYVAAYGTLTARASLCARTQISRHGNRMPYEGSTKWCLCSRISPLFRPLLRQTTTGTAAAALSPSPVAQKIVGRWLLTCAGMCFGAVVIGGITRLTESGLSMTQWHLIKGMKPPRTQQEWEDEFERYKQFPEYKYLERDLTLDGFKKIFFWEYIHRMWGRTIGLVFLLPAIYFVRKGYITRSMRPRIAIYGSLLLFQGLLGWYMVKSGLEDRPESTEIPRVSQYRLAAHLTSAMTLYSLFLYQGLNHILPASLMPRTAQIARLSMFTHGVAALVFLTAISGAFVAGLDAGLTYNTWPKMADRWIPDDLLALRPIWKNFLENSTATQFQHRHLGEFTATVVLGLWWLCHRAPLHPRAKMAANLLGAMAVMQVGLGIATLVHYVPVELAATHQAGAMTLLSLVIWLMTELRRMPK